MDKMVEERLELWTELEFDFVPEIERETGGHIAALTCPKSVYKMGSRGKR